VWDQCNDKWGVKYDEEDCSNKFLNLNWTMRQLKDCWVTKAELPLDKMRCNNLPAAIIKRFDPKNRGALNHDAITEEESLDYRYDCFKLLLNITRDREYCQNKTKSDAAYYDCIVENNITVIADDVLFRYGAQSYLGIGYDTEQTRQMDATGIGKDASRYLYILTGL
jgi:hypothetical protein